MITLLLVYHYRKVIFCLRMNLFCLQKGRVVFYEVHHVAVLCLYTSSEQTNNTLALQSAFFVFSSCCMMRRGVFSEL